MGKLIFWLVVIFVIIVLIRKYIRQPATDLRKKEATLLNKIETTDKQKSDKSSNSYLAGQEIDSNQKSLTNNDDRNKYIPRGADVGPPERSEDFWRDTKILGKNSSGDSNKGATTGYSQEYEHPIISKRR